MVPVMYIVGSTSGAGESEHRTLKLNARVIEHRYQRYRTVGDYWYPNSAMMQLRVSDMGNPDYEFLVLIHELVEAYLCKKRGIPEADITAFDMSFEARRDRAEVDGEAGDDPAAPYHVEHQFATLIEREIAKALDVDWDVYGAAVDAL
jgi:hypothetical protein